MCVCVCGTAGFVIVANQQVVLMSASSPVSNDVLLGNHTSCSTGNTPVNVVSRLAAAAVWVIMVLN